MILLGWMRIFDSAEPNNPVNCELWTIFFLACYTSFLYLYLSFVILSVSEVSSYFFVLDYSGTHRLVARINCYRNFSNFAIAYCSYGLHSLTFVSLCPSANPLSCWTCFSIFFVRDSETSASPRKSPPLYLPHPRGDYIVLFFYLLYWGFALPKIRRLGLFGYASACCSYKLLSQF